MITLDSIDYALHSIQIKDADGDALAIAADGSIAVTDNGGSLTVDDGGGSITVDGTVSISGNVTVDQGTSPWVIGDGGGSITVDAADLDIRDLAFATDKVDVSGSTVAATQSGAWSVAVSSMPGQFAEDSAHSSGHTGNFMLAVRNDAGGSLCDANGDYAPFQVNATGSLRATVPFNYTANGVVGSQVGVIGGSDGTNARFLKVDTTGQAFVTAVDLDIRDLSHSQDSVKIGDGTDFLAINADGSINVQSAEAGYSSWKVSTASVGLSEVQLVSSPLANRLRVEIQNLGSKDVWIRNVTGVSTSNGIKIPKGSSYEQALDAGASIFAISDGASADLRIAEYAA